MIRIYTGPSLEAKGITAALMEQGIRPVERNDHNSSVMGGFTASIPDQTQLFVREDQEEKAKEIMAEFFSN